MPQGIATAIIDPAGGGSNGVGLAIPIDAAKGLIDQILKFGRVGFAWRPGGGAVMPGLLVLGLGWCLPHNHGPTCTHCLACWPQVVRPYIGLGLAPSNVSTNYEPEGVLVRR